MSSHWQVSKLKIFIHSLLINVLFVDFFPTLLFFFILFYFILVSLSLAEERCDGICIAQLDFDFDFVFLILFEFVAHTRSLLTLDSCANNSWTEREFENLSKINRGFKCHRFTHLCVCVRQLVCLHTHTVFICHIAICFSICPAETHTFYARTNSLSAKPSVYTTKYNIPYFKYSHTTDGATFVSYFLLF